jgi:hypothetical protein
MITEFVNEVVEGEGGSGSVYVSGCNPEGERPFFVSVCTDSQEPTYISGIPATEENIKAVEEALVAVGLTVIIDPKKWYEQLFRWWRLGGGC